MLFRDTAELIAVTTIEDPDAYEKEVVTRAEVFVDAQAVRREEFYKGLQAGRELKAAFLVRACDYSGQERLAYEGKQYRIVRVYTKDGELLELNCSEEKGKAP